jgi:hypothetical protein
MLNADWAAAIGASSDSGNRSEVQMHVPITPSEAISPRMKPAPPTERPRSMIMRKKVPKAPVTTTARGNNSLFRKLSPSRAASPMARQKIIRPSPKRRPPMSGDLSSNIKGIRKNVATRRSNSEKAAPPRPSMVKSSVLSRGGPAGAGGA